MEAALLSLGISDEQLLQNVASTISTDIHQSETIPWLPSIPDLEKCEKSNEMLLRLISFFEKSKQQRY